MKDHVKRIHDKSKEFECETETYKKTFETFSQLKNHARKVHKKSKWCPYLFSNKH